MSPKKTLLWVLLLAGFACLPLQAVSANGATTTWTVSGQQIMLEGNSVFLYGVDYGAVPIGSDFGSIWDPFADQWTSIPSRDIPYMQAMGVQALRTYSWLAFPYTWGANPGDGDYVAQVSAKPYTDGNHQAFWDGAWEHDKFLDLCWNNGTNPIYVLIGIPLDVSRCLNPGGNYVTYWEQTAAWAADQYGNHPAVMGFCLGNEQNNGNMDSKAYWALLNNLARIVKKYAPDKLVTQAWQYSTGENAFDGHHTYVDNNTSFDFWGLNLYGDYTAFFQGYQTYISSHPQAKPIMLTEFGGSVAEHVPGKAGAPYNPANGPGGNCGTDQANYGDATGLVTEAKMQEAADALIHVYTEMKNNDSMCAGGFAFEWADEWWKADRPVNDPNFDFPGIPKTYNWSHDVSCLLGTTVWEEEYWGLFGVEPAGGRPYDTPWPTSAPKPNPPDLLKPRTAVNVLGRLFTGNQGFQFLPPVMTLYLNNQVQGQPTAVAYYSLGEKDGNGQLITYDLTTSGGIAYGQTVKIGLPRNATTFGAVVPGGGSWPMACQLAPSDFQALTDGAAIKLFWSGDGTGKCQTYQPSPPAPPTLLTVVNTYADVEIMPGYQSAGGGGFIALLAEPIAKAYSDVQGFSVYPSNEVELPSGATEIGIQYKHPQDTSWTNGCTLDAAGLVNNQEIQATKAGSCILD